MAARNGGSLTAKDKAKLTTQQNRASKNIYKKKHNDKTASRAIAGECGKKLTCIKGRVRPDR